MLAQVPSPRTTLDVCYLTDLRFPGGTSTSLVEEVRAATAAGYRVGALQLRSPRLVSEQPLHPGVRELIDDGRLVFVVPGEPVTASVAVVKHPMALAEPLGGRLPVEAVRVIVTAGQVPVDGDGTRFYEPAAVHHHVAEALEVTPSWHPVSAVVRRHLAGSGVPLAAHDWVEVIDADAWAVPDRGGPQTPPVIGRHARASARKWPNDPAELLAVYPDDGRLDVRVLGGADGVADVLGHVPVAWTVLGFGAEDPLTFLSGLDVYAYFHHPDQIEAFGRNVLEALAAGCVTVLPPHLEPIFGDAAAYATPAEVPALVAEVTREPTTFRARSARGVAAVHERFSHHTHVERLAALAGAPRAPHDRAAPDPTLVLPPGYAAQRPTVVVAATGLAGDELGRIAVQVADHRDHDTSFTPVLVVTDDCPAAAARGVATRRLRDRLDVVRDEPWGAYVARRLRIIATEVAAATVVPATLDDPDAALALWAAGSLVRPARRGEPPSAGNDRAG